MGARCRSVVRTFAHGAMGRRIDPSLSYFSFQPVLHDWCNKGHALCYPVCGMVHIKEPLLLIVKSSLCGGSGFPFSLSEWSLTICLTPYNRKKNVLSASFLAEEMELALNVYHVYIYIYISYLMYHEYDLSEIKNDNWIISYVRKHVYIVGMVRIK